jgi:hypothetical protein
MAGKILGGKRSRVSSNSKPSIGSSWKLECVYTHELSSSEEKNENYF